MTPITRIIRNGTIKQYDIGFDITDQKGVTVYVNEVCQHLGIDYMVEGDSIIMNDYGSNGDRLLFIRSTESKRLTDFDQVARFDEKLLDNEFDNLLRLIEDATLNFSNSISIPHVNAGQVDTDLPELVNNGYIKLNEAGNAFEFVLMKDDKDMIAFKEAAKLSEANAKNSELEAKKAMQTSIDNANQALSLNEVDDLRDTPVNLNALKSPKTYLLGAANANSPEQSKGVLQVQGNSQFITQEFTATESGFNYSRYSVDSGLSYSTWLRTNSQNETNQSPPIKAVRQIIYSSSTPNRFVSLDADLKDGDLITIIDGREGARTTQFEFVFDSKFDEVTDSAHNFNFVTNIHGKKLKEFSVIVSNHPGKFTATEYWKNLELEGATDLNELELHCNGKPMVGNYKLIPPANPNAFGAQLKIEIQEAVSYLNTDYFTLRKKREPQQGFFFSSDLVGISRIYRTRYS